MELKLDWGELFKSERMKTSGKMHKKTKAYIIYTYTVAHKVGITHFSFYSYSYKEIVA